MISSALLCVLYVSVPAGARQWKPTPQTLAQDYSSIVDNRGKGDIVMLKWFVPPVVPDPRNAPSVLDRYVIIAVAHSHMEPGGIQTFDPIDSLQVNDGKGMPLKLLTGDEIPPAVAGYLVTMEGSMRQSMGALGQGMHFFAFDGVGVHACGKGQLAIPYDGRTYTYDTPIPGCPTP